VNEEDERLTALRRARVVADPRKFRDYALAPEHPKGKARIFVGTLGFRPNSSADAWTLARLYEEQARERIAVGDVTFSGTISFGLRTTIVVAVRGVSLRTGWLLSGDELRLVTPFSGFARDTRGG
jgi:hypothetical protein